MYVQRSNSNFLVYLWREDNQRTWRKTLRALNGGRNNNKLDALMRPGLVMGPTPHLWEASTFTSASSFLLHSSVYLCVKAFQLGHSSCTIETDSICFSGVGIITRKGEVVGGVLRAIICHQLFSSSYSEPDLKEGLSGSPSPPYGQKFYKLKGRHYFIPAP